MFSLDDEAYQRTAGDDLYLHSIVCIVIVLVSIFENKLMITAMMVTIKKTP